MVAADRLKVDPRTLDPDDPDGWPYTWRQRALMALDCETEAERWWEKERQRNQRLTRGKR